MPIAGWGFAPALAAGNTVVLKPAEITPLTAMRIAELALEAGLPEGVFTVLPGSGSVVGQRFVTHPLVRKVCFTGSTEVGKQIMAGCADQVKRVTLELGGKSANVVFADADVPKAAATAPYAVFDNAGQDCCARSRILVERSAYDEFVGRLETVVRAMKVVDPGAGRQRDGPDGLGSAARLRAGLHRRRDGRLPGRRTRRGRLLAAADRGRVASTEEPVWREEVFGPVVAVMAFDYEEEAVALANDTEYGLSGSIYTRDLGRALRVSRAVEAGNLSVNSHSSVRYWTPFGGFKQSGLGRELGPDAPNAFTEEKNVFFSDERLRLAFEPKEDSGRTHRGQGRRRHRRLLRDRPGDRTPLRRGGREGRDRRPQRDPRQGGGRGARRPGRGDVRRGRRHRQGPGRGHVPRGQGDLRLGRHRLQQRGHQPTGGRLDPRHRPRGLGAGAAGQPDERLPVLQGRAALHARAEVRTRSSTPRRSWP